MLYVAITRTRNRVYVPKTLMPAEHPHSPKILVMKPISKETDSMQTTTNMPNGTEYKYLEKVYDISLNEAALKYSQTQQYWTDKLDKQLMLIYNDGITLNDIANYFGRTVEEIKIKVRELGI